jgi:hypothetical protein
MDKVNSLRWFDEQEKYGIVCFSGEKVVIRDRKEFDSIEKAFKWVHNGHIYDADLKKGDK